MVQVQDVTESEDGPTLRQRGTGNTAVVRSESEEGQEENGDADGEAVPAEQELSFDEQVNRARERYQPTPMEKFFAIVKSLILRALVVYFVMSFIRGSGKPGGTNSTSTATPGSGAPQSLASSNIYNNGTEFDMYVYISEDSKVIRNFTNAQLVWKQEGLVYGDWYGGPNSDGTYSHSTQVRLSKKAQNNGTVYIHAYVVPTGFKPDHNPDDTWVARRTVHGVKQLNKYKKRRYAKTHNLLTGETAASIEEQEKAKIMSSSIESHWHPNMTISVVFDWTAWTMGAVPQPLNEYVQFIPQELKYKPVLFFNDYWNLAKDYTPINSTTPVLPLTVTFQPLSLFKWQIYAAQTMRNQWQNNFMMGSDGEDEDQDALKEAILETNPYLLGLTFVVSILHSIFEFLAFKNDIQFWNNRKSLEGLSVRSVFFNVFQSVIVLLYVLDNETNFVIRVSVFVGLLIEIWKINKVLDVKIDRSNKILGIIPRITFADKGSYVESSTREYDLLAFRYLSWALFPLLVGYAVYSVLYMEHKGWYSWVLSMLYGFLLTFGFIMMTPQLFINYKLKSVAHLPWRMLTYKFLNTFIDDIFAFVIKMPTMYRIGTLRDDIIFFIYLYQRYVYRIDPTRVNEFGFSGDMLDNNEGGQAEIAANGDAAQKAVTDGGAKESSSSGASKSPKSQSEGKSRSKSKKEKKVQ